MIVRVFVVAGLVFLTSAATNVTVDVSVSVVLGDDLVLFLRRRGGCLWPDLDNPSSARGSSGVGAEIYARVDSDIATMNPIESLLASVGLIVSLLFDNAHRW